MTQTPEKSHTALPEDSTIPVPHGALPTLQLITLENADQVKLLRTLPVPGYTQGRISQCSLNFSPDGRLLVGACGKNQVPVWEVQSGDVRYLLYDASQQIVACDFSPDGLILACGGLDKRVTFWNVETGEKIRDLGEGPSSIWELDFSPDGTKLVSCSLAADIRLWDVVRGETLWSYEKTKGYLSIAFEPAGNRIAFGGRYGMNVGVLEVNSGQSLVELNEPNNAVGDVSFSPSGKWLFAGTDDDLIFIWDAHTYALETSLEGHSDFVNGVAFSPDENLLFSGSHDRTVGIWDFNGRRLLRMLQGHQHVVLRVAVNPEGSLVASISWDGTVRLWGIASP